MKFIAFIVFALMSISLAEISRDFTHTNFILIGATGDLAQKYLWRSIFHLFSTRFIHGKHHFTIYGCSRKSPEKGRQILSDILLKTIVCPAEDSECRGTKKKFVEAIQFHQLKTEKHYETLASKINENIQSMYGLQGSPLSPEDGRLIYLSIPPSAYIRTAMMVNRYLRPVVGHPWFRVAIEKPFGNNHSSAEHNIDKFGEYFMDKEVYRVDHYLGKTVAREILPFRYVNRELYEPLWNRQHIARVEVVMKEKLDVQGRVNFYDEVGVFRDVLQNHLTEMAVLVGMDLPHNSGVIRDILDSKLKFLRLVQQLSEPNILSGQYDTYVDECKEELSHSSCLLRTPTFGAAVFSVNSPRWQDVPFLLVSGKKLDEKISYIRIIFKDDLLRLQNISNREHVMTQMVFYINNDNWKNPEMITVSKNLPKPLRRPEWALKEEMGRQYLFGESINNTYQLVPKHNTEAYSVLLDALYMGHRHMFIERQSLLTSWQIWNNVVKDSNRKKPRTYKGGVSDIQRLDLKILGTQTLSFVVEEKGPIPFDLNSPNTYLPKVQLVPGIFRGFRLVTGKTDEVIVKLANELESVARESVRDHGVFHFAVPGGQTPVRLFQYLVTRFPGFPWMNTHIWQLDERCVIQDNLKSNFELLHASLLQHICIPYRNVHPMPVDFTGKPCAESDLGDVVYQAQLEKLINNSTIDFTLVGVGYDGHIASLFPHQASLHEMKKKVTYSSTGSDTVSPKRMTLTFPILNHSKNIVILILGTEKHEMLEKLSIQKENNVEQFPVLGLQVTGNSRLTWFIDDQAYYGNF